MMEFWGKHPVRWISEDFNFRKYSLDVPWYGLWARVSGFISLWDTSRAKHGYGRLVNVQNKLLNPSVCWVKKTRRVKLWCIVWTFVFGGDTIIRFLLLQKGLTPLILAAHLSPRDSGGNPKQLLTWCHPQNEPGRLKNGLVRRTSKAPGNPHRPFPPTRHSIHLHS